VTPAHWALDALVYLKADFDEPPDRGDWRAQSTVFLHRLRETLLRHPDALPIISTRPAYVAPTMRFAERILAVFDAAEFTGHVGSPCGVRFDRQARSTSNFLLQ
jgi:hypothetical protein